MSENSAILGITTLREAWLVAVRNADVDRLASLVADDVVIVHGDGRCILGRDEFKADFLKAFESFRIDQKVVDPEISGAKLLHLSFAHSWSRMHGRVEQILAF